MQATTSIGRSTLVFSFLVLLCLLFSGCESGEPGTTFQGTDQLIPIVAAENFYGDIARQIGGCHVSVTSLLSDSSVDPRETEANVRQAITVSRAKLVIANGGGFDSWMDKLLSSAPSSHRIVLKGFDLAPLKLADNEHVWYSIENIQALATSLTQRLEQLDPLHEESYQQNLHLFQLALEPVQQSIKDIQTTYPDVPVALTEPVFRYQATSLGLHVLTPPAFQQAIDEENDPPANAMAEAEAQIQRGQVKVLIYNQQVSTPITVRLRTEALIRHIPIVAVTELMPADKTYQAWMFEQLLALRQALAQSPQGGTH